MNGGKRYEYDVIHVVIEEKEDGHAQAERF